MRVVFDTNVLVSALRSRRGASFRLLELAGTGRYELCLSVPLLLEYEDFLGRPGVTHLSNDQVQDVLDYLCSIALCQDVFYLWRPFLPDPKDDLVLEVGVAARCTDLVTFNAKHFKGVDRFGLRVSRPNEFLIFLGDRR